MALDADQGRGKRQPLFGGHYVTDFGG
jgi:hypothetical protein